MTALANQQQIVLASASRARRELLAAAGLAFAVDPADVDEPAIKQRLAAEGNGDPVEVARVLARAKAENVSARHAGTLVVGADQVLALGDELLTKAKDETEARAALQKLRGRTHVLHAAVALAQDGKTVWEHAGTARLTVRDFSDAFLDAYLVRAGDLVTQSVGAYQLEGVGVQLFDAIEGDYFTILGLPLLELLTQLRTRGVIAP
jgi:nucleoside triphosphate pyrophosphatase